MITLRGACTANSSVPPTVFRVEGIAEFPFDQASQLTAVTSLRDFARACGDAGDNEADMLMIASRPGNGPDAAVEAIRRVRPDLAAMTNDELVARFQQVEFSYFRQISFVLATITMFFGLLLITVLLSVSTNQRLGEIAALRALGFSRKRMVSDVLWRSALLVGAGGLARAAARLRARDLARCPSADDAGYSGELAVLRLRAARVDRVSGAPGSHHRVAAIYPMRTVARLPISSTLRTEVIG